MALCSACQNITPHNVTARFDNPPSWLEEIAYYNKKFRKEGKIHLSKASDLQESAKACALCKLIMEAFQRRWYRNYKQVKRKKWQQDIESWREGTFAQQWEVLHKLVGGSSRSEGEDPMDTRFAGGGDDRGLQLSSLRFHLGKYESKHLGLSTWVDLHLYAEEGTPAALDGAIVWRPPLASSDCPRAHKLVTQWMETCVREHSYCRATQSKSTINEEEEPLLPTRVIDVGSPDGHTGQRLVVTNGARGHFIALSHCWGKRQQLTTARESFDSRLESIPWDIIPKTFQDAITTTRAIGLRYIWIDSLCIIQGDAEDWNREAPRMGAIYEGARLVIAASHASDGSEGCFFDRSARPEPLIIPYMRPDGERAGTISILDPDGYKDVPHEGDPQRGPLYKRAWITQEWLLARRLLLYTKSRICWSCKVLQCDEQNRMINSIRYESTTLPLWETIIKTHSARKLTFLTDRLMSIEGLCVEMQKGSHDNYHFGMWMNNLQFQLLWWPDGKANRKDNPLRIPTWSWASSLAPTKYYEENPDFPLSGDEVDSGEITIDNETLVIPRGQVKEILVNGESVRLYGGSISIFDGHRVVGKVELDEREIPQREQLVYCVLLKKQAGFVEDREYEKQVYFLALQMIQPPDTYVRIGCGWMDNFDWFQDVKERHLRIL